MSAAINPPLQSPRNRRQLYPPLLRSMCPLGHHLEESSLELIHLFLSAHGHAYISRPARPNPAYVDLFLTQCKNRFFPGPLHIDHELIRNGRDVTEVMLVQEGQHILTDIFNDFAPF